MDSIDLSSINNIPENTEEECNNFIPDDNNFENGPEQQIIDDPIERTRKLLIIQF